MKTFYIYFSSLNDDAQKDLLNLLDIKDPSEMNWDMDIIPIAMADFEEDLDKDIVDILANMIKEDEE